MIDPADLGDPLLWRQIAQARSALFDLLDLAGLD
jgi:succinylarginine dihydrolase